MKYEVETGSVTVMYMPSFIKTGSGIQKLIGRIRRQRTHTGWRSHNPTLGRQAKKCI
jgi:hypothetical protein